MKPHWQSIVAQSTAPDRRRSLVDPAFLQVLMDSQYPDSTAIGRHRITLLREAQVRLVFMR